MKKRVHMSNNSRKRSRKSKRQREKEIIIRTAMAGIGILLVVLAGIAVFQHFSKSEATSGSSLALNNSFGNHTKQTLQPQLDVQLLTINEYSRPGLETDTIQGVVIHYTANPGSTAQDNRNYFESLKDTGNNKVSSNFIIGLEGEIIQCIPTSEIAYASNDRNNDTVSIECCHPDETGEFTEATYGSLVELTAFLCGKFNLSTDEIIRHYDVTGKECPRYFVDNEDKWQTFKEDVADYIEENGS